ncbi:MAG TPA: alpha/beta hydrolase [Steroidobacteraceae bacterium]|nr:alpha/beta hydrolase [Steroidobacteraceae bacterium]
MNSTNPTEEYFSWCLQHPGTSHFADVAGNRIHYLEWSGPKNAPALLLIHGFMGHAHWWDFVAPALAENYRVLAMDIGGMGDSGYREKYSLDTCVAEIAGVIRHANLSPATVIGHSFGGRCTILTAHAHPELIERIIVVDSHMSFGDEERKRRFNRETRREKKRYPDLASAKLRFRLVPEEPKPDSQVLDHIATHSLKQDGDAWIWKFDEAVMDRMSRPTVTDAEALPQLKVSMDFVCGAHSVVVPREHAMRVGSLIPRGRGPIIIPGAHHHVPIGQPIALVSVLRTLLAK